MTDQRSPRRKLPPLGPVAEPLPAQPALERHHVLPLAVIELWDEVVEEAAVEVMDHVVGADLVRGQTSRATGTAEVGTVAGQLGGRDFGL